MVSLHALGWSSLYLNSRLMNAVQIWDTGGECLIVSICNLKSSELNNRSWQKTCYCKSIQLVTASVIAWNNFSIAFELFREHRTLRLMGNARTVLSKDEKRTWTLYRGNKKGLETQRWITETLIWIQEDRQSKTSILTTSPALMFSGI